MARTVALTLSVKLIGTVFAFFALVGMLVAQNFEYSQEEYLTYSKNGRTIQWDPSSGKENSSYYVEDTYYKDNLGAPVQTRNINVNIAGFPKDEIFNLYTYVFIASNGNIITETNGEDNIRKIIISSSEFPDYILRDDVEETEYGEEVNILLNPVAWIDKTHLLISKGEPDAPLMGIFVLDMKTSKVKVVLERYTYLYPKISPSGRYIAYMRPPGEFGKRSYSPLSVFLYDLKTGKTLRLAETGRAIGWTTKKIVKNSRDAGAIDSECDPFHCLYKKNTVIFKMPFMCGEAYRVSRDGECNTPEECGLGSGGYPLLSWDNTGSTEHHPGKRALDFTDQAVGGTTEDHLPVLASASGTVVRSGWENPLETGCVEAAGAGQRVWIKHTDGTFTLYGHMSKLSVSANQVVTVGQQIGLEGHTGHATPCGSGEHIHFEMRTGTGNNPSGDPIDSYWMQFAELGPGQIPTDEHIYISQNGNCPMSCSGASVLPYCGGTFTNQSNIGLKNTRATYFVKMPSVVSGNAASENESGPEKMYKITTVAKGTISVTLSNVIYAVGKDFDVFIMSSTGSCSDLNTLLHCKGTSSGLTAIYENAPQGTYYIVVDGVDGTSGYFTLNVFAPCPLEPNITDYGSTKSVSGRNITITVSAVNNGVVNAGEFYTKLILSSDVYLGNDYGSVSVYYSGLPAGYKNVHKFTWKLPSTVTAGFYYLLECIDCDGAITEINENDNNFCFVGKFYIPPSVAGDIDTREDTRSEDVTINNDESEPVAFENEQEQNELAPTFFALTTKSNMCEVTANGNEILGKVLPNSDYVLCDAFGHIVCEGRTTDGVISCKAVYSGIYFLTVVGEKGDKCVSKFFVK